MSYDQKDFEHPSEGDLQALRSTIELHSQLRPSIDAGMYVPTFDIEAQNRIRARLVEREAGINSRYGNFIDLDRHNISTEVEFMTTADFLEKGILAGVEVPTGMDSPNSLMFWTKYWYHALDNQGIRVGDGRKVIVHTTYYPMTEAPRQLAEEEALFIANHELVHGKITPKFTTWPNGKLSARRTGCKSMVYDGNKVVSNDHQSAYEAQTDALAVFSANPQVASWQDLLVTYLRTRFPQQGPNNSFQMEALTHLMSVAYPNFQEGIQMMGETYYRCEGFFPAIWDRVEAYGDLDLSNHYRRLSIASQSNNPYEMRQAAGAMEFRVRDLRPPP